MTNYEDFFFIMSTNFYMMFRWFAYAFWMRRRNAAQTPDTQGKQKTQTQCTDGGRAALGGVSAEGNHPRTTDKAKTRPTRAPQGREPPTTHGHRPGTATRRTTIECFSYTLAVLVHTIIRPRDNSKKGKSPSPAA